MRSHGLFVSIFFLIVHSAFGQLELLLDVNTQPSPAAFPEHFVAYGDQYLFTLDDDELGRELWISNGTLAGTHILRDINLGNDAFDEDPCFTVLGGIAYFFADDDIHGLELWRTDGTLQGTWMVKDVYPGDTGGVGDELIVCGGKLFFPGRDDGHGMELWVSDGTTTGTYMVEDIVPGFSSSNPGSLTDFNGTLVFQAYDDTHENELRRIDSSLGGQMEYITDNPLGSTYIDDLAVSGPSLFFTGYGQASTEFYFMDGSFVLTSLPAFSSTQGYVDEMQGFNDGRVLLAFAGSGTWETTLWLTDGNGQTQLESSTGPLTEVAELFHFNGLIYFQAAQGSTGVEPYVTNGTTLGTLLIQDINTSGDSDPYDFVSDGNYVYFLADDDVNGTEIWKTDGTPGNTSLAVDLTPGPASSSIYELVGSTAGLAFAFEDPTADGNLATFSDGSTAGTTKLVLSGPVTESSAINGLHDLGNKTIFSAKDGVHGRELWVTDRTSTGTVLLADQNPGPDKGVYTAIGHAYNGQFLYVGQDASSGYELFTTDGTIESPILFYEVNFGFEDGCSGGFFELDGWLYFSGTNATSGSELWRTDGTRPNTELFYDAVPGPAGSDMSFRADLGGVAILTARNDQGENTIWRTDGTTMGTYLVGNYGTGLPISIGTAQGLHFYRSCDGGTCQIWQTDGTISGTQLCSFLAPYVDQVNGFLAIGDGAYFFVQYDQGGGKGSFYWDGNTTVTSLYDGGLVNSNTFSFGQVEFNGKIAAIALTPNGSELVVMDPLTMGVEVIDILPGPGSGATGPLTVHEGQLYFVGTNGNGPKGLWRSDGTAAGTYPVTEPGEIYDIGAFHSTPDGLLITGTGSSGHELYIYRPQGRLAMRAILQGAYETSTALMRDALRENGKHPANHIL
jgi:ELWxxDGT repeat protein